MENSLSAQQHQHNNNKSHQTQNIKESTARNIHAFSGLELSSIVESASTSKFEDIPEDKGRRGAFLFHLSFLFIYFIFFKKYKK